jgi:hypothetical protein
MRQERRYSGIWAVSASIESLKPQMRPRRYSGEGGISAKIPKILRACFSPFQVRLNQAFDHLFSNGDAGLACV